jgi:hypothetical protein
MRKRILFFHHGGSLYGSDRVFLSIIKSVSLDYEPIIILDHKGPLVKKLKRYTKKIYIHRLGVLRRKKSFIKIGLEFFLSLFYINKIFKKYSPHACCTNTTVILSGALVSKLKGVKHVWFVHEHPKTKLERTVLGLFLKSFSDIVVVPSKSVKNWVLGKVKLIPYVEAIETKDKRKKIKPGKNKFTLGCVGMIHPKKGQAFALEIFKFIIKKRKDLKLVIVGGQISGYEDYYENLREKIRKENLGDFVSIIGFKDNILSLMREFDVIFIPSQYEEPFPLVAQEAMFLGKPVIATRVGGLKELVKEGKNGVFISQKDARKAAGKILKFINDKRKLKRIGKKCRLFYKGKFNHSSFKKEVNLLFR